MDPNQSGHTLFEVLIALALLGIAMGISTQNVYVYFQGQSKLKKVLDQGQAEHLKWEKLLSEYLSHRN